ncbi:hypothetical protein T4B_9740 [Trichinella pseudospiralis]|uniref:Uncharacterized protein n=1 Tax=Trichinella pseudospiralis TaxID=6337 RepID=A0A0V1GJT3_TRIPS|nr:hypothetical protein T4B_9740 [Trichinella pseudospiralis]
MKREKATMKDKTMIAFGKNTLAVVIKLYTDVQSENFQKAATRLRRCTHKIWEKTAPNMTKHFYCFKKAMAPCMTKMGVAATKRKYKKSVL